MRKHVIFTAIAVAAVLFTACESVEIPAPDSGNAIEFRTLVDKNGTTKASLVDNVNDLSSFFVTAWLDDDQSKFMESAVWRSDAEETGWDYSPKKYFPVDNDGSSIPVNFYAYAPIKDVNMVDNSGQHVDLVISGSYVSFNYTVPYDQSVSNTAVDLLVASVLGATGDPTTNSNQVAFIFEHALSGVKFSAKNNNEEESELVYVISNIEITNLANEGIFTYLYTYTNNVYPSTWDITSSQDITYIAGLPKAGVSLMPTGASVTYMNLLSENDIMMVLPQEINSESKVRVKFSLKDGSGAFVYNGSYRDLPLPNGFNFDPGTLYNFQFQFDALNAITFEVTKLEGWVNEVKTFSIPAP